MTPASRAPTRLDRAALWVAVALGLSIPVSTALDSVLVAVLVLAWAAGGGYAGKAIAMRTNAFAVAAVSFLLLALAGCLYSAGSPREVLYAVDKASILLIAAILVSLGPDARMRELALSAFLAVMAVTLLISVLLWLGAVPDAGFLKGVAGDAYVFKKRITHGALMAFAAYAFALQARAAARRGARLAFGMLAVLAACNVAFMVQGRTGVLILAALFFYALVREYRWRGVAAALLAGIAVGIGVYHAPSSAIHQRVAETIAEVRDWRAGKPATAANRRPESWGNSLEIIRRNPVLGVGTGGFAAAYAKQVEGTAMIALGQPENQYLLTAVQLGAVGLLALLALFVAQWRLAARLATRTDTELARGLVIFMAVGCMFNSFLLDHTEALFYAWLSGLLFAGLRPAGAPAAALDTRDPGPAEKAVPRQL